jgi:hypothetical protein
VGGRTKQEVKDKLEELHADLSAGISAPNGRYTVGQAIEDWLRDGLQGRAEKTVTLNRGALKPFVDRIGATHGAGLRVCDAALRMLTCGDAAAAGGRSQPALSRAS